MDPETNPIPPDLLARLAESSTDLQQLGNLTSISDAYALERAESRRQRTTAERGIEERLDSDQLRVTAALANAREAATAYPGAFDRAVAASFTDQRLAPGLREAFDQALGVQDGKYAAATLEVCDRIEASSVPRERKEGEETPPVTGADITGCDLIALGGMLGGATCVVGCGPCCVVGAVSALTYVGICTG